MQHKGGKNSYNRNIVLIGAKASAMSSAINHRGGDVISPD